MMMVEFIKNLQLFTSLNSGIDMKPKGNGLIPLHDEKQEERGFFCIKLVQFLNTEAEMGTDEYKRLWDERFSAAKNGCCFYKDRCPIYERTVKNRPVQLNLFT